jgi:hypothetical protein
MMQPRKRTAAPKSIGNTLKLEADEVNWGDLRGRRKAASQRLGVALILAVGPVLLAAGCRSSAGKAGGVSVAASIAPQPVHTGTETISFQLTDAAHQPVSGAHVQVEGDMSHPGMAPAFADALETAPGNYKAQLSFTMGGDWVVLFHIALSDGRRFERQMDVRGVESN